MEHILTLMVIDQREIAFMFNIEQSDFFFFTTNGERSFSNIITNKINNSVSLGRFNDVPVYPEVYLCIGVNVCVHKPENYTKYHQREQSNCKMLKCCLYFKMLWSFYL